MKTQVTEYPARQLQWPARCICVAAAMMFFALSAHAQDQMTAPIGGPGGSEFVARCPAGQILGGLEMRTGDDIDAIRPLCKKPTISIEKVAIEPGDPAYNPNQYDQYEEVSRYGYGDAVPTTDWYGGPGGSVRKISGGSEVTGIYVEAEGVDTVTVNGIALVSYRTMSSSPAVDANALAQIQSNMSGVPGSFRAPINYEAQHSNGSSMCPVGDDGWTMFAVGIHGRTGVFVDAIGLICGYPETPQRPVPLGRVDTLEPSPVRKGDEPMICAQARDARARNSPVAPDLTARCEAVGGDYDERLRHSVVTGTSDTSVAANRATLGESKSNLRVTRVKQPMSGGFSRLGRLAQPALSPVGPAVLPAEQPPAVQPPAVQPPAAQPPAAPPPAAPADKHDFTPPVFNDGAQLWACANAVQGKRKGSACSGLKAGKTFCRAQGFSGALQKRPDGTLYLMVTLAQPGIAVRANNGDACTANECVVISQLHCAP